MNQPDTLEACVTYLVSQFSEEDLASIRSRPSTESHFSLGMELRNTWNLWNTSSELNRWFQKTLGISHGDDLSGTILAAVWAKVRNEPFVAWEHVKQYKRHWLRMGVSPMGQNPLSTEEAIAAFQELK